MLYAKLLLCVLLDFTEVHPNILEKVVIGMHLLCGKHSFICNDIFFSDIGTSVSGCSSH